MDIQKLLGNLTIYNPIMPGSGDVRTMICTFAMAKIEHLHMLLAMHVPFMDYNPSSTVLPQQPIPPALAAHNAVL